MSMQHKPQRTTIWLLVMMVVGILGAITILFGDSISSAFSEAVKSLSQNTPMLALSNTVTSEPTNTYTPTKTDTPPPTNTLTPAPTNTPPPTDTPLPTDTPTSVPTDTPVPADTLTATPTNTPTLTDTPTNTPIPLPIAVVRSDAAVHVRGGPGTNYDIRGLAHSGEQLNIIGRNEAGDWIEICWADDEPAWIWRGLVELQGIELDTIPVESDIPPTPTPVPTPAATPLTPIRPASTLPAPGVIHHVAPSNGAECPSDKQVGLEWDFAGSLGSDGIYSVRIWFQEDPSDEHLIHDQVEQPLYVLNVGDYAGRSFCWNVQAVRPNPDPPPEWITLSPNSDPWCFSVFQSGPSDER
jgi:hypothetical protein